MHGTFDNCGEISPTCIYRSAQFCCSHWRTVQQDNKAYQTRTPQNKGSRAVHGSLVLHLHQLHHMEVNGLPRALNGQHCIHHMLKPMDQLRDNHRDITVQLPHKEQTCIPQCLGNACKMIWMHEKREGGEEKTERKKGRKKNGGKQEKLRNHYQ